MVFMTTVAFSVCLFGVSSVRLLSLRCVCFFSVRFFSVRFFSVLSMCFLGVCFFSMRLFSMRCVHFSSVCIVPFGFVPCRRIESNDHHDQTDQGQSSGENFGFLSKNKHRRRHLN